jgi:hypothetical protein
MPSKPTCGGEPPPSRVAFDTGRLGLWDSSLLAFLTRISSTCRERGVALDPRALPPGLHNLLDLAEAVPERADARKERNGPTFLERVGANALGAADAVKETLSAVCPGYIDTPMMDRFTGGTPEGRAKVIAEEPVGRMGKPEEIAAAAVWLCSDAAAFVVGHAMVIDGGQTV